jgi:hypothetical protein
MVEDWTATPSDSSIAVVMQSLRIGVFGRHGTVDADVAGERRVRLGRKNVPCDLGFAPTGEGEGLAPTIVGHGLDVD